MKTWTVLFILALAAGCTTTTQSPAQKAGLPPVPKPRKSAILKAAPHLVAQQAAAISATPIYLGHAIISGSTMQWFGVTNRPTYAVLGVTKAAKVATAGLYLSTFYSPGWTAQDRVEWVDVHGMVNGKTYEVQWSNNLKTWATLDTITWASTNPDDYLREGFSVPMTGNYNISWRVVGL